jgi:stress response protein YsnF
VETGRVRLNKTVSEQDVVVEEQRIQEEIHIERIPIDRFIDQPAAMRHDGDTLIIPVMEEVPVVVKRLKLKEELHVTKRRTATPQSQPVRLRSETVTIERLDPRPASDVQGTDGEK